MEGNRTAQTRVILTISLKKMWTPLKKRMKSLKKTSNPQTMKTNMIKPSSSSSHAVQPQSASRALNTMVQSTPEKVVVSFSSRLKISSTLSLKKRTNSNLRATISASGDSQSISSMRIGPLRTPYSRRSPGSRTRESAGTLHSGP